MTTQIAGVVVAVASAGPQDNRNASTVACMRTCLPVEGRSASSTPVLALLQTVTNSFQLIFNCFRSTGSIAGVVGAGVFGGKTGFLYFFHQNAEFLAFYFHCYIVTKVVRHSVSKGFGCNTHSKLLQNVTGCYEISL